MQGTDPQARLEQLLREREPLYRQIADLAVSTNHRRVLSVAEHIVQQYRDTLATQGAEAQ
ncbi:MAG: hypothetical protein ACREN1_08570 [Candidatus Dormibacteria bacterium]